MLCKLGSDDTQRSSHSYRCCGHPSYDHLTHSSSLCGSSTTACAFLTQLIHHTQSPHSAHFHRCCGHSSYDHLTHSSSLCGSSTTACAFLTQLIEALQPAAQEQLRQRGLAAAQTEQQKVQGKSAECTEDPAAGRIEAAMLQAMSAHGLDYVASSVINTEQQKEQRQRRQQVQLRRQQRQQRVSQEQQQQTHQTQQQQQRVSQEQQTHQTQAQQQQRQQQTQASSSTLPPLPSLLAGVSELLKDTMGVWLEIEGGTQDAGVLICCICVYRMVRRLLMKIGLLIGSY